MLHRPLATLALASLLSFTLATATFGETETNSSKPLFSSVIVAGTFKSMESAQKQLEELKTILQENDEMQALQQTNGFEYIARESGQFHIAAIEPIYDRATSKKVLAIVKSVMPGTYEFVRSATTTVKSPVSDEKAEPETAIVSEEKPVAAPVETPEPVVKTSAPVIIKADVMDKPVAVKPTSAQETESEEPMIAEMLMYGGIAVAVLILVLLVMRRGKSGDAEEEAVAEEKISERDSETVAPAEIIPEPEAVAQPVEKEAAVEAEPVPEPETTVETVEEEALVQPEEVAEKGRKRREPKPDRGKISKEDLAEFAGNRIMIAEDNLINQKVLTSLLAVSGMDIVVVNDGQEAMDTLAQDSNFQMILMDAHMPNKDGFEATREIRANSAYDHIPVVALSGDVASDDIRKMREAGMEEQLAKPIHLEDLYDVMYCYFDLDGEDQASSEPEEVMPETDELHAGEGLEVSGGDAELYKEILTEFVEMYGDSDQKLHEYIIKDDTKSAQAMMLDVKGLAASIGADLLAETAEKLRQALINGDEPKYNPLYEEYCIHIKKLVSDIDKL